MILYPILIMDQFINDMDMLDHVSIFKYFNSYLDIFM